jgi:hypothetical protein
MTNALANKQGQLAPLKNVDAEIVLDRYLAGETGPQIARSLGVTKQALSHWLITNAEVQWKSAQLVKALTRKDEAEELMDKASNPLDLARAREQLRGAQWDLERVCRRIYGQDAPAHAQQAVVINIVAGTQRKPQQYDSEAAQHGPITAELMVDKKE